MKPQAPGIQETVYSVSELTYEIKQRLEGGFTRVLVEGEISNVTIARSGHWYFTLKDPRAQLSCVMFRGNNRFVRNPPKEGDQLLLRGRLSVYEPRGSYQLVVDSVEDRGLGKLMAAFEELKDRLGREGLFDSALKRPLPQLPHRIALVTSPSGAAVHDMIRVILRRHPRAWISVVPTLVQGTQAPAEIVQALQIAGELKDVDLVIVGRGGGSIEDLWAFNDEAVARAIRACPVPIISAVGHETDVTIADFAADLRAPTPSAAAELAVPVLSEQQEQLGWLLQRAQRAMQQTLQQAEQRLERLRHRLPSPERRLIDYRLRLDDLTQRLFDAPTMQLQQNRVRLQQLAQRLERQHPGRRFERLRADFLGQRRNLDVAMQQILQRHRERLGRLALRLDALSPLAVLGRGYALVTDQEGHVVTQAMGLSVGDRLNIHPAQGEIQAEVTGLLERSSIGGKEPKNSG